MGSSGPSPAYHQAIEFYLREDVSSVLWELARRRPLHFYYKTDRDYRLRDAHRWRIGLHCLPSPDRIRDAIRTNAWRVTDCGDPFYPFFTMASQANAPDRAAKVVGWDLSLEADLDMAESFRALIPLVAVLDYLDVPRLAKFSGHRSLHVLIPAEALSSGLGQPATQAEWFRAQMEIGRFLCRLVPALTAGWVGVARQQPLTTPYSLHRYNGLLSLPVALDSALSFDPASAELGRFAGVTWRPSDWDSRRESGRRLLDLARRSEREPELALRIAEEVFRGERWQRYLAESPANEPSATPAEAAIFAGPVALNHLPEDQALGDGGVRIETRVRRAIATLDDPDVKTASFQGLFGEADYHSDFRLGRREASRVLALWATTGAREALRSLIETAGHEGTTPGKLVRAVRLIGLLPESAEVKAALLRESWRTRTHEPAPETLCLALALAELASACPEALDELDAESDSAAAGRFRERLLAHGAWKVEDRPDLAVAALCLAFGRATVRSWLGRPDGTEAGVVDGVFGGKEAKFEHAARRVLDEVH